jgi:hypothetical protein
MSTLPTIRNGATALYPVQRTANYKTSVLSFVGDTEQRWISQLPVQDFLLTYNGIEGYDVSVLREFFTGLGGESASSFDFSLDGVTVYHNCVMIGDSFSIATGKGLTYNVALKFRQTRT